MRQEVILVSLEDRFSVARIPSLLYRSGCRITVLGDASAAVTSSRFVDHIIPCKLGIEAGAAGLRKLLGNHPGPLPWVVFGDEAALQAAMLCRGESWLEKIFPVDPQQGADIILRKAAFMTAAETAGIPIPPMRVCRTANEAQQAADKLEFPLFMKRDVDCAGAGVVQVVRRSDISAAFQKLSDTGPVLIQQMVHGRVGKTNGLYMRGRLMCHTSAYAKRTWPGKFGPSCVREYFVDDRLEKIAADIGTMTGFNGLCGFDWIQDSTTGDYRVIEFNGRTIASYHLGKHVGVDYEQGIRDFLAGTFTIQRPQLKSKTRPIVHMFPQDIRRCISDKDVLGLGKWLAGAVTNDMPWNDTGVIFFFFTQFFRLGMLRIRRLFRKRYPQPAISETPIAAPPTATRHAMV